MSSNSFLVVSFFLSFFLGLHLQHMEVTGLGVKLEVPLLANTTVTATWDPSCACDLTTSHGNTGSPTHWARPEIEAASSWILVGFVIYWATVGTPWIPFISFSSLIALTRTSKTMLNNSDESGYPCLVPDFDGNAFSFSPLRMMLNVGLSCIDFIMLRWVPSMHTFWRVLIRNWCWISSKVFFFLRLLKWSYGFLKLWLIYNVPSVSAVQ